MSTRWIENLFYKYQKPRLAEYLQSISFQNGKVLDIGCGYGRYSEMLGPNYTGIDLEKDAVEHCRKNYPEKTFLEMDANKLDFPDNSFDLVISTIMFHHLTEEQFVQATKEIKRVLRPGGHFWLVDIVMPERLKILGHLAFFLDERAFKRSPDQLEGMLERGGLKSELKDRNYWPFMSVAIFDSKKE